jgi:hypothetical protein
MGETRSNHGARGCKAGPEGVHESQFEIVPSVTLSPWASYGANVWPFHVQASIAANTDRAIWSGR